ncbi:MAG: hypothetical protein C4330_11825 [Chitinophagaceae bacterium]
MTASFFNHINRKSQADLLYREGEFLYTRQEPQFIVDVYRLEEFFVEIYLHKHIEDFVTVRSFEASDRKPQYDTESETFGLLSIMMGQPRISA